MNLLFNHIVNRSALTFCVAFVSICLYGVSFRASVQPDVVEVGNVFRVQYTLDAHGGEDVTVTDFGNFEHVAGPYVSSMSNISIINGKATSKQTETYTYTLRAKKEGTYAVPPASITYEQKKLTSNTPKIQVVKASDKQSGGQNSENTNQRSNASGTGLAQLSDKNVFMRAIPSKTRLFEQECLVVTYKLYSLVDVRRCSGVKVPDFKGFLKQDIKQSQNIQIKSEYYNGKNYGTVVLYQVLLFPQKTGNIKIEPFDFEFVFRIKDENQFGHGFFAQYLNSYRDVAKTLRSPGLTIKVDELPKPIPAKFNNAVGNFRLKNSISSRTVDVNSPITLTYTISGTGNLKMLANPDISFPTDFESYDPKVINNFRTTNNGLSGTKTIEYLLIPRSSGNFTIPAYVFTYFDPQTKRYVTLESESYDIQVKKGNNSDANTKINNYTQQDQLKVLGQDIRYINVTEPTIKQKEDFFFGSIAYWLWIFIPILLTGSVVFFYRNRLSENEVDKRYRKANKIATKRLKQAKEYMSQGKKELFFEEVLHTMWGYLSDKLNIPIGELSKENVETKLEQAGIDTECNHRFINLLNTCEFARYAPSQAGDMNLAYTEAVEIISNLQETIK